MIISDNYKGVGKMATFRIDPKVFLGNIPPSPRFEMQLELCKKDARFQAEKNQQAYCVYDIGSAVQPTYIVRKAGLTDCKLVFTAEPKAA